MRSVAWTLGVCVLCGCGGDEAKPKPSEPTEDAGADGGEPYPGYAFRRAEHEGCAGAISYDVFAYTGGEAEATLLFINGRTEYTEQYHHLVPMLEGKPWHVVMYDHFGQGRSEGLRAHALGLDEQLACDLLKVMDATVDKKLPVLAIGHSTGGLALARALETAPERFTAAVLNAPLIQVPERNGVAADLACGFAESNAESGKAEEPYTTPEEVPDCADNVRTHDCAMYDEFKDDPLTLIGQPTWGWLDMVCKAKALLHAEVAKITVPVRMHQAELEQVVDKPTQNAFCDAINAAANTSCEFAVYEGMFHKTYQETDRAQVVADTLTFFEAQLSRAAP